MGGQDLLHSTAFLLYLGAAISAAQNQNIAFLTILLDRVSAKFHDGIDSTIALTLTSDNQHSSSITTGLRGCLGEPGPNVGPFSVRPRLNSKLRDYEIENRVLRCSNATWSSSTYLPCLLRRTSSSMSFVLRDCFRCVVSAIGSTASGEIKFPVLSTPCHLT